MPGWNRGARSRAAEMARIRTIKPDFWMDARLAKDLTRDQRLFYIGLWNQADDEGRFRAHPDLLKGALFPYDSDIQGAFVKSSLRALVASRRRKEPSVRPQ